LKIISKRSSIHFIKSDSLTFPRYLEESFELMQTEFESMEDYWQKKIDEEKAFYEDQLKVSETQFKELELRMKEYKEILESVELSKPDNKDNLYIIDEQRCLEEKVNEWEEEINQLKLQLKVLETAHEEEILTLVKK
jgi:glutaredoxin 2